MRPRWTARSDLRYLRKVMIPICRPTLITIIILKVIECWNSYVWPRLITDDPSYYLVSNGIQEIRENGFGRENIPAMMAAVVVISLPLIVSVPDFPQKGHGGCIERRYKGMRKHTIGKLLLYGFSDVPVPWLTYRLSRLQRARVASPFRKTSTPARNYEITFWAKNDTNKTQTEIYKKAIEDFEELYPNITVNLRLYTDYGKIYNDVITNIATDTTPNVCITYPDHIATYLTGNNVVVPLDDSFYQ